MSQNTTTGTQRHRLHSTLCEHLECSQPVVGTTHKNTEWFGTTISLEQWTGFFETKILTSYYTTQSLYTSVASQTTTGESFYISE